MSSISLPVGLSTDIRPGPLGDFNQVASNIAARGDLFGGIGAERREVQASFLETWKAFAGLTFAKAITDNAYGARHIGGTAPFSPGEVIAASPTLSRDPRVQALWELGAFDDAYNPDLFQHELGRGLQFLNDLETLHRSSWGAYAAAWIGAMIGDPTNLIPIGAGAKIISSAKAARTGARAARALRVAKRAGQFGSFALGAEVAMNALQPASNEPGPANEAFAIGMGAAFGVVVGSLAEFPDAVKGQMIRVTQAKRQRLRENIDAVAQEKMVDWENPTLSGFAAMDNMPVPLSEAIKRDTVVLQRMLEQPAVDNELAAVRAIPGDENWALLEKLHQKYSDAGFTLHSPMTGVTSADGLDHYILFSNARKMLDEPVFNVDADPADFNYGRASMLLRSAQEATLRPIQHLTIGGRILNFIKTAHLERIATVYRLLNSSAATVTRANLQDPFNFRALTPAESIKALHEQSKDLTVLNMTRSYQEAGRSPEPITYNGRTIPNRFAFHKFAEAVGDLRHRLQTQADGYEGVEIPADIHPAIRAAAELNTTHLNQMARELQQVGMLTRKADEAVAKHQSSVDDYAAQIEQATARATDADTRLASPDAPYYVRIADAEQRLKDQHEATPTQIETAQSMLDSIHASVSDNTNVDVPESFGIHPDDIEHMSQAIRDRITESGYINEDAAVWFTNNHPALYAGALDELVSAATRPGLFHRPGGRDLQPGKINRAAWIRDVADGYIEVQEPSTRYDAWLLMASREAGGKNRPVQVQVATSDMDDGFHFRCFGNECYVSSDPFGKTVHFGGSIEWEAPLDAMAILSIDADTLPKGIKVAETPERLRQRKTQLQRKIATLQRDQAIEEQKLHDAQLRAGAIEAYQPVVHDIDEMVARSDEWQDRMFQAMREYDLRPAGYDDDMIRILPYVVRTNETIGTAVLEHANRGIEEGSPKFTSLTEAIKGMTEGDLPDPLRESYRAARDSWYKDGTQSMFDTLTNPKYEAGVLMPPGQQDPMQARVLHLPYGKYLLGGPGDKGFLVTDQQRILNHYHHAVAGKAAVRRALQLIPEDRKLTMLDGTPVIDGAGLRAWLRETIGTLEAFGRKTKELTPDKADEVQEAIGNFNKLRNVERDLVWGLDLVEGNDPRGRSTGAHAGLASFGRIIKHLSVMNKLGASAVAQLNDAAPVSLYAMQRPETLRMLRRGIKDLNSVSRRDLELWGVFVNSLARARSIADVDSIVTNKGFGSGLTRAVSQKVEEGVGWASDIFMRATGMNWITEKMQQFGAISVADVAMQQSKKVIRIARQLGDVDISEGAGRDRFIAMLRDKSLGIAMEESDVARLNKMGLDLESGQELHRQVYDHGVTGGDETPIKDVMTFDEYMASGRVFSPNMADWNTDIPAVRDLYTRWAAGVNAEVKRHLVAEPGPFDRPMMNQNTMGALFNQFQGFGMAFTNQRLSAMAQMPMKYQTWYVMSYLFLGAMSDAISSELNGRRSLEETANLWATNPLAMIYGAWDRSGLFGAYQRPLAILDNLNVPWAPGNLLGNVPMSAANRHVQPGRSLTLAGPAFADIDKFGVLFGDLISGRANENTAYTAAKLVPLNNWVLFRMLSRGTQRAGITERGLPITSEYFLSEGARKRAEKNKQRYGPQP